MSLRDRRQDVSSNLADVIERAISPDSAARFDDASAFERALARAEPSSRRSRMIAAVTIGAILLAVGFSVQSWLNLLSPNAYAIAGTWVDKWTQNVWEYACDTPVGFRGTTTLVIVADSSATFHGTFFGIFPVTGQVAGNSIRFRWDNVATGVGLAQGGCDGTMSRTGMQLTCREWILPQHRGLRLNGESTDHLTRTPSL